MKTPNYVLDAEFNLRMTVHDGKIIPAGTHVKPIELCYVPKHVVDDIRWTAYNMAIHVFCYTRYGIIPLPRRSIREI